MCIIVHSLIVIFIVIIIYQLFLGDNYYQEGLDNSGYKSYNTNDPNNAMILAQQNAGNIEVLKKQLDDLTGLKTTVTDLSGNVTTLQTQVNSLVQSQQEYLSQNSPPQPPTITGATN